MATPKLEGCESRMLSGFNTNFRHRGVLFHVQSEDSGVKKPRVVTHLFRGGDIMASVTGDYADKLSSPNLEAEVRALMEHQHKAMLRALSRGNHDRVILERLGADIFSQQRGGDTDVTIPPPEVAEAVEVQVAVQVEVEEVLPEVIAVAETSEEGAGPESAKEHIARVFGDRVVSQKPLDEVVLEFLVDNARKRKRNTK